MDDRDYHFSNTNTPQRGPPAADADEEQINDAAFLAPSPYQPGSYAYTGFAMEAQVNDPSYAFPYFDGFPQYTHQSPAHHPVALRPTQLYEQEGNTDISPPPKLNRTDTTNFVLRLSHSTSSPDSGSSSGSKTLKLTHEPLPEQEAVPEHRDASEQKSAERAYATVGPHSYCGHEYAGQHADVAYAAAKMYTFDDNAVADPNVGQGVSPIKTLPVQAARKPPAKKTSKAKTKRTTRRTTKKATAAARKNAAAPKESTSEQMHFVPTKDELIEACTPRAQQALRTWYKRLGELYEYKRQHGDCSVPQKYPKNPPLGTWVNKQRMEYKMYHEGGKHSMTDKKLQKLAEIGFDWGKRKGDASWETKFRELSDYNSRYGSCKYFLRIHLLR